MLAYECRQQYVKLLTDGGNPWMTKLR
jgi:hypothetical protein